jgi:hypothetical protein
MWPIQLSFLLFVVCRIFLSSLTLYRLRLKRDGTRAETRFRLSAKRTSPFKSVGASVQSTAGSRVVRISGSNAGYTTFRGSVIVLATHSIPQFPLPFPSPHVRHRVLSSFKRALTLLHFSHDRSNWSPSFTSTSTTFQNLPGTSDLLS